ncbi:RTase [Trichonephila clavipes]|nr:RTase [Trichonephila clavipes]
MVLHGQMIDHLGLSGRQRILDIINYSWNKGKLPRDWWRVTGISIKKVANLMVPLREFSFFQEVPQGSVLSLTLFSLNLSGIENVVKRKCEVGVFADDIVLWKSDSDLTKLERDINLVLEDIRNFTLDYNLTFNPTKSMVYTDGSRVDYYRSARGIYIKSQDHILRIHRRNPDGCSVFRSELIAIDEALDSLASLPNGKEI